MTSIRKMKKRWKSSVKREWYDVRFSKRLETLRKLIGVVFTFSIYLMMMV